VPIQDTGTALEHQIRSQPAELERIVTDPGVREQIDAAVRAIRDRERVWLVGTGTSLHAAELGAAMFEDAGVVAHAVGAQRFVEWEHLLRPGDACIVISHTGETAYALGVRAHAATRGLPVVPIGRVGLELPGGIATVEKETAETYTVSYTAVLAVLALMAATLGAPAITEVAVRGVPAEVARAIENPAIEDITVPARLLVLAGIGPASVTAREGALKVREAARFLAEGYDAEYLLHGSAVPLTSEDRLVVLTPPTDDVGFVDGLQRAASAAGVPTTALHEPAHLPILLAQIPLTARLQLLSLHFATSRGQNPDVVIEGAWLDEELWTAGAPAE
jgi:glutamine---fructose-6-phosphate transaminase (isomerizing)